MTPEEIKQIEKYIMPETAINFAELAIVFGTRHGIDEFCIETHRLWKNDLFKWLIVSGGKTMNHPETEASIIKDRLLKLGVPEEIILIEDRALNTGENVIFSKTIAEKMIGLEKIKSILAIGKICSSRRYLMTLERHWSGVQKMIAPINYFNVKKQDWHQDEKLRSRVLSEWKKIPQYLEMGFLKEIEI